MTASGGIARPQGSPEGEGPARPGAVALLLASAAAVGGFLFGFDSSVINGAVEAVEGQFDLTPFVVGFVVSSALLGCALGAWVAGPLGDRVGRVRVMLITALLFVISALGSALAVGPADLIVWRITGGLAIGAACPTAARPGGSPWAALRGGGCSPASSSPPSCTG